MVITLYKFMSMDVANKKKKTKQAYQKARPGFLACAPCLLTQVFVSSEISDGDKLSLSSPGEITE